MNDKAASFRRLHEQGCFVLPNPWDAGSAKAMASLGFSALATSSAALGFSLGVRDAPDSIPVEIALRNIREIVEATPLPVSADFQNGYGATIPELSRNIRECLGAGVAGISIEDATGDADQPLYSSDEALEHVRAARSTIDEVDSAVVLTARCEAFLVDHPNPLKTAIERLVGFAEAGADCLYAPGLRTPEEVRTIVDAVAPKPVNVLLADPTWMTRESLAELGVRRISVGSAIARVAWKGIMSSIQEMAEFGTFNSLRNAESFAALNKLFSEASES